MNEFLRELEEQRWDDHRFYHQSRINQSLHLVSAIIFCCSYIMLFYSPAIAAALGWLLAMATRQSGHFFFESKDYDNVNRATHEYKERIKVGYNLKRKIVLLSIWAASPFVLLIAPSLFGLLEPHHDFLSYVNNVGVLWLGLGGGALVFRCCQLAVTRNLQTGVVWVFKIITDPFHDIKMYHRAPFYVMRGELFDPIEEDPRRG